MTRRERRRRWLILHKRYERRGLVIFRRKLRETASRIPFLSLTDNNYEILITINILNDHVREAYIDLYEEIGVRHGKKIGEEINQEIRKNFDPTAFEGGYRQFIANWLVNNAGARIASVKDELLEYLIKFIADGLEQNQNIRTISRELQKHILSRGFYRWQVERIVRTETTAAANWGAIQAGESSGIVWEKEWISSNDSRTRRRPKDQFDHIEMDGAKVPKDENFNVQGDQLAYPGDPNGQPGNVINCRCTVAIVPKRDEEGNLIFTRNQPQAILI